MRRNPSDPPRGLARVPHPPPGSCTTHANGGGPSATLTIAKTRQSCSARARPTIDRLGCTPKSQNGRETTDAPPCGVPSSHSHQLRSTPARGGFRPEIGASPPRSPAESPDVRHLALGSPAATPCAHLRGERRDPRGMSRAGRCRRGALRAWRCAPGDVRGLPGNPPRGSQIRKRVAPRATRRAPPTRRRCPTRSCRSSAIERPRVPPRRSPAERGRTTGQTSERPRSRGRAGTLARAHLALLTPTPSRSARRPRRRAHTCEARGGTRAE